jgi:hypothetical protein
VVASPLSVDPVAAFLLSAGTTVGLSGVAAYDRDRFRRRLAVWEVVHCLWDTGLADLRALHGALVFAGGGSAVTSTAGR